jgi:hypothetical protein
MTITKTQFSDGSDKEASPKPVGAAELVLEVCGGSRPGADALLLAPSRRDARQSDPKVTSGDIQ